MPLRIDVAGTGYNQMPNPNYNPSAPSTPSFNIYNDLNIHPPTYQECMFDPNSLKLEEKKGEILDDDEKTFKPLYPVFKDSIQM